jgi:hypothetical protein
LGIAIGAPRFLTGFLGAPPVYALAFVCVSVPAVSYLAMRALVFCRIVAAAKRDSAQ